MSAAAAATSAPAGFTRWLPAYIGIGSNLADPRTQVRRAIDALKDLPATRFVLQSPLYETPPFGEVTQPTFVNAVAGLLTQLTPEELLGALRALERDLGREPPRESLKLPHTGIPQRDFVLYPLADIAAHLELPGMGSVWRLRDRVENRGVRRL
jgi:2-amino-4-hydroxy-6-hydroxymethyldihydropteridine diphosphokinase